jgi:hypothetical protein
MERSRSVIGRRAVKAIGDIRWGFHPIKRAAANLAALLVVRRCS